MGILVRNNKVISAGGKILYSRMGNPFELPNLKLYLSATKMTQQSDESLVSSFTDFSGNSFHAVQANTSLQPKFDINQFGVNAGIKFDGVDDALNITGAALDIFRNINEFTVQIVCKRSVISTSSPIFKCQINNGLGIRFSIQFQADGRIYSALRKDDSTIHNNFSSVINNLNTYFIQATLSTLNVLYLYVDGVLVSSVNTLVGNIVNTSAQNVEIGANTNASQYGSSIINGISVNTSYSDYATIQAQYRGYLQRGYL